MNESSASISFEEFQTAASRFLKAIEVLAMEKGYENFTEDQVCSRALMPAGSIQTYFKSFEILMQMHYDTIGLMQFFKVAFYNERLE